MSLFCHKLIAETAKEMAGAEYEDAAGSDDQFYKAYSSQKQFIRRHWKNYVGVARKVLTQMLAMDHVSEILKDEIADALIKDREIPQGGDKAIHHGLVH